MPAFGVIKLADANLWLAIAYSDHQHHPEAKTWFDAQPDGSCGFCRVTQMALLRHLTNSKIMGQFAQGQQDAWKNYDKLANDPRVMFLNEPPSLEGTFRSFTQAVSPSHKHWTDAYLAAFAVTSQTQLVTFDKEFHRYAGLDFLVLGK